MLTPEFHGHAGPSWSPRAGQGTARRRNHSTRKTIRDSLRSLTHIHNSAAVSDVKTSRTPTTRARTRDADEQGEDVNDDQGEGADDQCEHADDQGEDADQGEED
jgi:hypothetical protein